MQSRYITFDVEVIFGLFFQYFFPVASINSINKKLISLGEYPLETTMKEEVDFLVMKL